MWMALLIGWLGVWSAALADEKYPDGMTIVETPMSGDMQVVTGSKMEMDVAREPASTFKAGIGPRCGDTVEGGRGIGVKAVTPEIDQPALCSFGGKNGRRCFGGICGAERSDRGKDPEELDEGRRPGGGPRRGAENNPAKGTLDGGSVDAWHCSLGRAGGKKVAGCLGLERGEGSLAGQDRLVRGLSLDDGIWEGQGGDSLYAGRSRTAA